MEHVKFELKSWAAFAVEVVRKRKPSHPLPPPLDSPFIILDLPKRASSKEMAARPRLFVVPVVVVDVAVVAEGAAVVVAESFSL